VSSGVVLDASGGRPDPVIAAKSEWTRLHNLVAAGRGLADLLSDLATIVADKPLVEPRVSWISALDALGPASRARETGLDAVVRIMRPADEDHR